MRIILYSLVFFLLPVSFSHAQTFFYGENAGDHVQNAVYDQNTQFLTVNLVTPIDGCDSNDGNSRLQAGLTSSDADLWVYNTDSYGGSGSCNGNNYHTTGAGMYLKDGSGYYTMLWGNSPLGGDWLDPQVHQNVQWIMYYFDANAQSVDLVDPPLFDEFDFQNPGLNTRFTDLTWNQHNGTSTVRFKAHYYIDPAELSESIPSRKADEIRVCVVGDNLSVTQICWVNEIQTSEIPGEGERWVDSSSLVDGNYTARVTFWNREASFKFTLQEPYVTPFSYTDIYLDFTLLNGVVTYASQPEISNYLNDEELSDDAILENCGLSDLSACITEPLKYLFLPSKGMINSLMGSLLTSESPLVQTALMTFTQITDAKNSQTPVNTLEYRFQIAEAGIDVEMVSINTLTQLFGDSLPIFRNIMIIALWFGFLSMLLTTTWSRTRKSPPLVTTKHQQ